METQGTLKTRKHYPWPQLMYNNVSTARIIHSPSSAIECFFFKAHIRFKLWKMAMGKSWLPSYSVSSLFAEACGWTVATGTSFNRLRVADVRLVMRNIFPEHF